MNTFTYLEALLASLMAISTYAVILTVDFPDPPYSNKTKQNSRLFLLIIFIILFFILLIKLVILLTNSIHLKSDVKDIHKIVVLSTLNKQTFKTQILEHFS